MIRRPPRSTLFPYTTLFRSQENGIGVIVYSPMSAGLLTGAMTRERVKNFTAEDWRRNLPNFQEPLLSRNRSEEHTSELQSQSNLVCRLLLDKKKYITAAAAT